MQIAPKKFGDALNAWFRSLGQNWKTLLLTSLVVHVPLAVVVMLLFWMTGAAESFALFMQPEIEVLPSEDIIEALIPLLWTIGIWSVLQIPASAFVYLAAARILAGETAGTSFTTGETSRFASVRAVTGVGWWLLVAVGALLLVGVATALGWVLISAGGTNFLTVFVATVAALTALVVLVWLGVSVSFGLQIIALEGLGPVQAVPRSFLLVQGRWWITLGYLALSGIIASTASQVLSFVLVPFYFVGIFVPEAIAVAIGVSVVLQGPLIAAMAAASTVWYIDLRARSETLLESQLVVET